MYEYINAEKLIRSSSKEKLHRDCSMQNLTMS
jgi:hypothetical protein